MVVMCTVSLFRFYTNENLHALQTSTLEMSIYRKFPWIPWVPWDSHGNGNHQASFMGMEMGMGMA